MSRYLSVIGCIFLCLIVSAPAQTPSPEAMNAARGLVATMKLSNQYRALLPAIVLGLRPIVAQDRPEIERDYDAMTAVIVDAYAPFENEMLEAAAAVYASHFTVEELRQLDSFYRQPVGQKLLEKSPTLALQTSQIGQDIGRRASDDLRRRLTEALRQKGHKL